MELSSGRSRNNEETRRGKTRDETNVGTSLERAIRIVAMDLDGHVGPATPRQNGNGDKCQRV